MTMRVEKVGRYEVIETLARGGMGVVYKARDPLIDRVVAVKTLGLGLSPIEAQAFRKQFAREAKSAGRLSHPNIVTIHDMGESDDGAYIAMEFLEGRPLRDILDSGVVLPPPKVAAIALQVAEGLAFAHRNGVVHCDIKPANIMVQDGDAVKITDFGIAQLPTGSRTFAGQLLGSPRYISPEQIIGHPVDARADLFSLGAVLYEMLTGVPPFAGDSIDEILYQVINDKPEPPSQRNRSLPQAFDAIVARAMAKNPDDRYQTAAEFAAAVRPLAYGAKPTPMPLPPLPVPRPAAPGVTTVSIVDAAEAAAPAATRWHARRIAAYAVPAALIALGIGWTWTASRDDSRGVAASAPEAAARSATRPLAVPAIVPPIEPAPAEAPAPPPAVAAAPAAVTLVPERDRLQAPAPGALARLSFAISPWGEVYVDGKKRGVTPPLRELALPPGRYEIEIRNAMLVHRQTVELFVDAPARIKHKFQ
jgi:serine/threonine-protein kinase